MTGGLSLFHIKNHLLTIAVLLTLALMSSRKVAGQTITVSTIPETLCAGENFTLNYSASGFTAIGANKFIAELSDASGSFTTPINIGENITLAMDGSLDVIIPESTVLDSGYRIRVNSTEPAVTGDNNGTDINVDCSAHDYYWVGGSGKWSDNTAHWSKYPDQFSFHDYPPGAADNVFFTDNSFTSGGAITIDVAAECNNMIWMPASGANSPMLFADAANTLTIYGDFTLDNGVQRSVQDLIFNAAPLVTQNISFADNISDAGNIVFQGGGSWEILSDITADSIALRTGTFNMNNNQLYVDVLSFYEDQISNWGSSEVSIASGMYNYSTSLNFGPGSSTFNFNNNTGLSLLGPFTFNDANFNGVINIESDNTFNNLTFLPGSTIILAAGSTQTISGGTLKAVGLRNLPITIKSSIDGTQANISQASGTIKTEYLILSDNNAEGGATFNTEDYTIKGDPGKVTGWNLGAILKSGNFYWFGDGGNWSDYAKHWASKSNGTLPHPYAPGPADNVFFNIGSFSKTGQIVILDHPAAINNMTWENNSAVARPSISGTFENSLTVHGDFDLDIDLKRDITSLIFDSPNSGNSINFANNQGGVKNNNIVFRGGGSWNLTSSLMAKSITMQDGDLNTFSNDLTLFELSFTLPVATVSFGGSTVYLGSLYDYTGGLATLDAGTSTILISQNTGDFNGNFSLNDVQVFNGAFFTVNSSLSINNLTLDPGSTLTISQGKTITTAALSATGTSDKPIRIQSDSQGNEGFISQPSGAVVAEHLILSDNHAQSIGSTTFNANNSISLGNALGLWSITEPPVEAYFWIGGSGNWSDVNHWATDSVGTALQPSPPGITDNVFFTSISFPATGNETVVIDQNALCNSMIWSTTIEQAPTLFASTDVSLKVFGSFILVEGVQRNVAKLIFEAKLTANFIDMADNIYGALNEIDFTGTGEWILSSALKTHTINFKGGILHTNDLSMQTNILSFIGAETMILNTGSSLIQTSELNNFTTNSNLSFNAGTSTVEILDTQQDANLINGPFTLYDVVIAGNTTINGSNTLNSLTVNAGNTLLLKANDTQSLNSLALNGLIDAPIAIESTITGAQGIFSVPGGGSVIADFVSLKDNNATGGATFTAANSAVVSNVTGWTGLLKAQNISFPILDDVTLTGDVTLSATSSSGLPVSYTIEAISGNATEANGVVTPLSTGLVGITAAQSGDLVYAPANPVTRFVHIKTGTPPNELGRMKQASYIVGVPNGVSLGSGMLTSKTLPHVTQAIVSPTGKLIAAGKGRVLIWNELPDAYDIPADIVVGQADFTTLDLTPSRTIMGLPSGNFSGSVAIGPDGQLIVSDGRGVLIWHTIPTVNGVPADLIIGQGNFTSTTMEVAAHKFKSPFGVAVSNDGKLIISDVSAHRVLVYNQFPVQIGDTADVVIGQPNFISSTPGLSNQDLAFPGLVSITPDNKLLIADINNNRIMVFNTIPTQNHAVADAVIGQADFNSNNTGTAIDLLAHPIAAAVSRTGKLAISDVGNSRILIYDQIPANNSILPDTIIGQHNFDSKGLSNGLVSLRSMAEPVGLAWDVSENLLITDSRIERIMVYGAVDNDPPVINILSPIARYTKPGTNKLIINTDDRSGINIATAYYQEVTKFNAASPNYLQVPLKDLGNGDYEFDLNIIEPIANPLGIEYYLKLADAKGNADSTLKEVIPVYYPEGIPIDSYGIGSTINDYKIMTVPLLLDSADAVDVFDNIFKGTYDDSKMRIFAYQGNALDYTEYGSGGFKNLEAGKGYYALSTTNGNIITTAGVTSFESNPDGSGENIHEFKINLVPGWNLIGNPFLNDVNWADIQALTGIAIDEVGPPQDYDDSTEVYQEVTTIPFGKGVFVHNGALTTLTLRIPAKVNVGGRLSSPEENTNPIYESSWEVRFKTGSGSQEATIGAIGMEEDAHFGKDKYDRLNPPPFANMKVIDFNHQENFTPSFKKDIRESSAEEKWSFKYKIIDEDKSKHELHWDNSYFGDSAPDLYLVDKTHFVIINMKEDSSYNFSHGGLTNFEIYYGENSLKNLLPDQLEIQNPYPNPFQEIVNFNIGLPISDKEYRVVLNIYNTLGKRVATINHTTQTAGLYTINWTGIDNSGHMVPKGVYAYRILISGDVKMVVTGKIIKQ